MSLIPQNTVILHSDSALW